MENKLDLSLIICTRNRDHIIPETLDAAAKQSLDSSKYEVLILDQSTDDKTENLLKQYPDFRYIRLNSRGLSVSRNEGIKYALGNIIVYADDDILFDEHYLQNILDFFNNSEFKPDMIGGKILPKYLAAKPEWIDGPLLGALGYSDYGDKPFLYDLSHPKHIPYGGNMAIKKECLERIGGFSTISNGIGKNLTVENEDVMFTNKLGKLGYRITYCPQMLVYHKVQPGYLTYDYYKKRYFAQGRSDAYAYYLLQKFKLIDIPKIAITHKLRIFESLFLRFLKSDLKEKYYQKLRLYYNTGYLISLTEILFSKKDYKY